MSDLSRSQHPLMTSLKSYCVLVCVLFPRLKISKAQEYNLRINIREIKTNEITFKAKRTKHKELLKVNTSSGHKNAHCPRPINAEKGRENEQNSQRKDKDKRKQRQKKGWGDRSLKRGEGVQTHKRKDKTKEEERARGISKKTIYNWQTTP